MTDPAPNTSGMYFLANDRVLNWAIAFLESVRAHDPDVPLVMIPFEERTAAISALSAKYRFEIFDDPSLAELDRIGARLYPDSEVAQHTFRKLAVFWGPFETFLFSDVDIVNLQSVEEFRQAYERSGLDLLHADEDMCQVYIGDEFIRMMVEKYGARGFNTGFWSSRRGLFTLDDFSRLTADAVAVRRHLNAGTMEQPFLNYCCDLRRVKYGNFADLIPGMAPRFWAGQQGIECAGGKCRINNPTSPDHGKKLAMLHWAGVRANVAMPHRDIFLNYRLRPEPRAFKARIRVNDRMSRLFWGTIQWGRSADFIRRTYKRCMPHRVQHVVARALRSKH